MKKFKVDLSVSGIEKLIKDLEDYRDNDLVQKTNKLAEVLAQKGVEIAKTNITTYDAIFTRELIDSIHYTKGNAVFYIVADSTHAAFVEFGTGQIGKSKPYPYPLPEGISWEYNSGSTIFEVSPGQYGWIYPGRDGKYYFTQGMPSRPFMYNTTIELMNIVVATAKEVFRV